jgi:hypothetical protein
MVQDLLNEQNIKLSAYFIHSDFFFSQHVKHGGYLAAAPRHSISAMCKHCTGCCLSCSVSCSDSEFAAVSQHGIHIPKLQEILKTFPIVSHTFSMPSKEQLSLAIKSHCYSECMTVRLCFQ